MADNKEQTKSQMVICQTEALRQSILKKAFEGNLTDKWRKEHPELIS